MQSQEFQFTWRARDAVRYASVPAGAKESLYAAVDRLCTQVARVCNAYAYRPRGAAGDKDWGAAAVFAVTPDAIKATVCGHVYVEYI